MMPERLPRITLLTTGGTIAGQASEGRSGYQPAVLGPRALVDAVPQLSRLANLSAESFASIGSPNMSADLWIRLAQRITELFGGDQADGVVVTHGTDTLEETAYFLSLVLPAGRPLVLVGAMRPAGVPGADGPANLWHAVALAASPQAAGRGPLVLMNEQVYSARDVQKVSASGVAAFAAPGGALLGEVFGDDVLMRVPLPENSNSPVFTIPEDSKRLPRVDILYAHADQSADLVDAALAQGARGLVLAGVGAGNAPDAVLAALRRAAESGIAVVRSSRIACGYVGRHGEIDDQACGFIAAGKLPPAKARILLMLALTNGCDLAGLRQLYAAHG